MGMTMDQMLTQMSSVELTRRMALDLLRLKEAERRERMAKARGARR